MPVTHKIERAIKRSLRGDLKPGTGLNLALQGGGAHGAFTWGVLDRLLQENCFHFNAITGASAGAINAVVMCAGLCDGGAETARERLAQFWRAISLASGFASPLPSPSGFDLFHEVGKTLKGASVDAMMRAFRGGLSPYDVNPLNFDPLRATLKDLVDFEKLVGDSEGPKIYISATQATNGRLKIFSRADLSLEAVLASACLPNIHQAVEVDGVFYWDGGFSANPPLSPLVEEKTCKDSLFIQLCSTKDVGLPTDAAAIAAQLNSMAFGQSIRREVETLAKSGALKKHRFFLIDGTPHFSELDASSALKPDWDMLCALRDKGRTACESFLRRHGPDVSRRSDFDLAAHYDISG